MTRVCSLAVIAALAASAALCAGCEDEPEGPPPGAAREAAALRRILDEDPALGPIEDVDGAVDEDRPVLAAERIALGALPAARRQVERVERADIRTAEVRAIQAEAVEAYRHRVEALESYRAVLARGTVEDLALHDALRAQRVAGEELVAVYEKLDAIAPLPEERRREPSDTIQP